MKYEANATQILETHLKVVQVLDGDSLIVASIFGKNEKEIRLYGLDAPENKHNRKLREMEKKCSLAGEFLIQLGRMSTDFILTHAAPGTSITIITEKSNPKDFYGRQLAYVILPSGECLNEVLIREGYARAESEYLCSKLPLYQQLNFQARVSGRGLYAFTNRF